MDRRFFGRVDIKANGELLWATKRLGRVKTHREYITTVNVSIDGAKILVPGSHAFPVGARARLKLGIEFCDVEILESDHTTVTDKTYARLLFLNPSTKFVSVVERWMPISTEARERFTSVWI